jgi:hypothetical protein
MTTPSVEITLPTLPEEPAPLGGPPTTDPGTPLSVPEVTLPEVTLPEVTLPEVTLPEVTVPETVPATEPATTAPPDTTATPDTEAPPAVPGNDASPGDDGGTGGDTTGGDRDTVNPARGTKTPETPGSHDLDPFGNVANAMSRHAAMPPLDDGGSLQVLASAVTPTGAVQGVIEGAKTLTAQFGKAFDPTSADKSWGGLGAAAPRFGPWVVLLAMAWIVRTVIASILADRTSGPRRRRWTLL